MIMKRIIALICCIVISVGLFSGCASVEKKGAITVTDQTGRTCTIEKPAERIVSGYYVSTSACIALGLKDKIVGIEEKSDKRPIYGLAAPGLTDSAVNVGNAKNFDVEKCLSVNPDLVILPKKAKDYAEILTQANVAVIVVEPETSEKLDEMIRLIGALTGTAERAEKLVAKRNEILDGISEKTKDVEVCPSVYFCNPGEFLRTAPNGMYQADLLRLSGAGNCADLLEGDEWVDISSEQLLSLKPDVIIIPANSTASGVPEYVEDIYTDSVISSLDAVKNGEVYCMPFGFESWDSPVPSGVLGAVWLTHLFHPEIIDYDTYVNTVFDFYKEFYGFEVKPDALEG